MGVSTVLFQLFTQNCQLNYYSYLFPILTILNEIFSENIVKIYKTDQSIQTNSITKYWFCLINW